MIVFEPFRNVPLSKFHDDLIYEFPNAPTQMLEHYVVRTARVMADEWNVIRRRIVIDIACGVTRYRLVSPDGLAISRILGMHYSPRCGCADRGVRRSYTAPADAVVCAQDHAWYDNHEDTLHVELSCANGGGELFVEAAVVPGLDACELPAQFGDDLYEPLIMGTRANLMLVTGRPWSNIRVGGELLNEFRRQMSRRAIRTAVHKQAGAAKMNFGRAL